MGKTLIDERYKLRALLGSGGMSEVYLAHDEVLDRDVALKLLKDQYASDEEFIERFKREARSAASLSHPHIVYIFGWGESEDGTYYITMEYLLSGTLKDHILQRGALPPQMATEVALQIAKALRAAHENGVIHRDIKPRNILITDSGHVKVTDFGIARAAEATTISDVGDILGSVKYMSPEQAMGERVGPASDLYSLGVVLYEMLTGRVPFEVEVSADVPVKHAGGRRLTRGRSTPRSRIAWTPSSCGCCQQTPGTVTAAQPSWLKSSGGYGTVCLQAPRRGMVRPPPPLEPRRPQPSLHPAVPGRAGGGGVWSCRLSRSSPCSSLLAAPSAGPCCGIPARPTFPRSWGARPGNHPRELGKDRPDQRRLRFLA